MIRKRWGAYSEVQIREEFRNCSARPVELAIGAPKSTLKPSGRDDDRQAYAFCNALLADMFAILLEPKLQPKN